MLGCGFLHRHTVGYVRHQARGEHANWSTHIAVCIGPSRLLGTRLAPVVAKRSMVGRIEDRQRLVDSTAFRASLQPQIDFRPNSTTSYFVVRKPLPLNCWHRPVRDRNPFLPFEEKVFAGGCSRCCSLRLDRFGYAFSSCTSRFVAAFRFQSPPRSFPQKQPTQNSLGAPCSG